MIEELHSVTDDAKQSEVDQAVEASDSFDKLRPVFEDLAGDLAEAVVEYHEGGTGGQHKSYRVTEDGLTYQLNCRLNLDNPDTGVTCRITVEESLPIDLDDE